MEYYKRSDGDGGKCESHLKLFLVRNFITRHFGDLIWKRTKSKHFFSHLTLSRMKWWDFELGPIDCDCQNAAIVMDSEHGCGRSALCCFLEAVALSASVDEEVRVTYGSFSCGLPLM